jgi:hypothetical protein
MKVIALVLIVAGIIGIVVGSFSFTTDTTEVDLGALELKVSEEKTVNIPLWAGVGAIALGGGMLIAAAKGAKSS